MQDRQDIERLVGRAVLDKEFRGRLLSRPQETALEEGVSLTEDQLDALKSLDQGRVDEVVSSMEAMMRRPIVPPGWYGPLPPKPDLPIKGPGA